GRIIALGERVPSPAPSFRPRTAETVRSLEGYAPAAAARAHVVGGVIRVVEHAGDLEAAFGATVADQPVRENRVPVAAHEHRSASRATGRLPISIVNIADVAVTNTRAPRDLAGAAQG